MHHLPLPISRFFGFARAGMLAVTLAAHASSLVLDLDRVSTGHPEPGPVRPWITAEFLQIDGDTVQLSIDAPSLLPSEFLTRFWFNFDPSKDVARLSFDYIGGIKASGIDIGANKQVGAGSLGRFDVSFTFDPSARRDRFTDDEKGVYAITYSGVGGLSVHDFATPSSLEDQAGNSGVFAAAHVQGIPFKPGSALAYASKANIIGTQPIGVADNTTTLILLSLGVMSLGWFGRKHITRADQSEGE